MSERDLQRIEVLTEVLAGRRTAESAAAVLELGSRQTFRLLARYARWGRRADSPGPRPGVEPQLELRRPRLCARAGSSEVRGLWSDSGDRSFAGKTRIKVGRETLRRWMVGDGLWLSRKQRRTFHQPRLRRESYGELIQIDGSEHRWFEQRGDPGREA